jgi:exonuclease III
LFERQPNHEPTYRAPRRPASALIGGDFNLPSTHAQHGAMLAAGFVDAWQALNPGRPHPPSFRVYEKEYTPYCCDFFFVTPDLVPRLSAIDVDVKNQASDHQPVILDLR